jgi:hypothetical protein
LHEGEVRRAVQALNDGLRAHPVPADMRHLHPLVLGADCDHRAEATFGKVDVFDQLMGLNQDVMNVQRDLSKARFQGVIILG